MYARGSICKSLPLCLLIIQILDVMGSWYNELEYLEKSGRYEKELKGGVKYRLAFKLRFPFPKMQTLIEDIQVSHSQNNESRISYFDPEEPIDAKQQGFSKIFIPGLTSKISESMRKVVNPICSRLEPNLLTLIYFECVYRYLRLRMEIIPSEFIQLLSLKLRVDFGKYSEMKEQYIRTNFKAICQLLHSEVTEELSSSLLDSVVDLYNSISFTATEAMQRFVFLCGRSVFFFYEQFPLKLKVKEHDHNLAKLYHLPDRCYIALGLEGVFILDKEFTERKHFTFKEIFKWGYSEKLFILIIDDPAEDLPVKLSFTTRMASNIVYSLNSLCNLKRGMLPEENQLQMNRNVTREISQNKFFKRISKFPVRRFNFD